MAPYPSLPKLTAAEITSPDVQLPARPPPNPDSISGNENNSETTGMPSKHNGREKGK
ncbi:hypothetical protein M413DRAFT_449748 [Hebeloma cylindrosporum]|uniref:Uncharacterized protein n=1 Tax=Hebeloma cylindrosporum TaxID=76867 RepID=A0A0C3BF94_HEBCY|nr:hypothetical protein M413DRAFT_449748 [Hebeloma cylindrosporum h7]